MDWKTFFDEQTQTEYWSTIKSILHKDSKNQQVFPDKNLIFQAFNLTPFDKIRVVILGQDPYHNPGQANGLAFSVPSNISPPPSLKNIFKELENDLGLKRENSDLSDWARQGVLLLNSSLTVLAHRANSHANIGWEELTNQVIKLISNEHQRVVFILWGNFAKSKIKFIDTKKHFVLTSSHPSPLSAHQGFLGSKPFSKTNNKLLEWGAKPISWL